MFEAETGTISPERPDLIHRGPAAASVSECRVRSLLERAVHVKVNARERPERSEGGATTDPATRNDLREFGVALAGGVPE